MRFLKLVGCWCRRWRRSRARAKAKAARPFGAMCTSNNPVLCRHQSSTAAVTDLRRLIETSPVMIAAAGAAGGNPAGHVPLDEWRLYGRKLRLQMRGAAEEEEEEEELDALTNQRIFQLYLPLYFWLREEVVLNTGRKRRRASGTVPLFVGLSCPQGGGKTTLVNHLEALFTEAGVRCAVVSMDDFYLTRAGQSRVADAHKDNPLLQCRGNPGTHDMRLVRATLDSLLQCREDAVGVGTARIPRYDKSCFDGRGDRAPESEWSVVELPVDIVILEGWCLGFRPTHVHEEDHLAPINRSLREWCPVWDELDAMIVVKVGDIGCVYAWREEAEAAMRASGRPAMSPEEVRAFVDVYMPAYREYTPALYSEKTGHKTGHKTSRLSFAVDRMRRPCG